MSAESYVDDNNNDGTNNCRVTNLVGCCNSIKDNYHSCVFQSKNLHKVEFPEETKLSGFDNILTNNFEISGLSKNKDVTSKNDGDFNDCLSEKGNLLKDTDVKSAPIKIFSNLSKRGILKYPSGWRRRAFSESSTIYYSESSSDDNGFFGTSLDSPDILFEVDNDFLDDDDRPKKNVSFSDKMSTFVFRPNSSILGRRLKNQKRAQRKKDKKLRNSSEDLEDFKDFLDSKDEIEIAKQFIEKQRSFTESYDSISDISSSSGCDCSASDCSGDETSVEVVNRYENECSGNDNTKVKRKNRRKRNRKNKQNVRTNLETGGYDSE